MKKNYKLMILAAIVILFFVLQYVGVWYTKKYLNYGTYGSVLSMSISLIAIFAGMKMAVYYIFGKKFKLNYDYISVFIINMIVFYIFIYTKGMINILSLLLLDPFLIILLHYKKSDNRIDLYSKTLSIQILIDLAYGVLFLVVTYLVTTTF